MAVNRIVAAIDAMDKRLAVRLDSAADIESERAKQALMNQKMNIEFDEYCVFQDKKSQAQAAGILTCDEAMTIYRILGGGPEDFNKATLAQKVIVNQIVAELMRAA